MKQQKQIRKKARFRFYEELNDFLPSDRRKKSFIYLFYGSPGIKDVVEALGVPHVEVDLILVNGISVDFQYQLCAGDEVSIYPVFESFDISSQVRLRPKPLRETRFILDVHLGKMAKTLRMLGFDTLYQNDFEDLQIVQLARQQKRIILTRDRELLKHGKVDHGYWVRAKSPTRQVKEVVHRFDLSSQFQPFHRCMSCNGLISEVEKEQVLDCLEPKTRQYYNEFFQCDGCQKVYWKGSHFNRMEETIRTLQRSGS